MEKSDAQEKNFSPERLNFIESTCGALLIVARPIIPERIIKEAISMGMEEKAEFHISVIASRNAKKIQDFLITTDSAQIIKDTVRTEFIQRKWEYELLEEYFLIKKYYNKHELEMSEYKDIPEHNRFTLIQKIELDDLKSFYEELSKVTNIKFDIPFPHITLFSGSDYEPMAK